MDMNLFLSSQFEKNNYHYLFILLLPLSISLLKCFMDSFSEAFPLSFLNEDQREILSMLFFF